MDDTTLAAAGRKCVTRPQCTKVYCASARDLFDRFKLLYLKEVLTQIMMAPETVVTSEHNKPQGPPPQQQGGALDWIKIDINYFKTPPGLLKIVQLVLGILCMALASPWYSTWFVFVAVVSFITTLMWSFVFLLSIKDALKLPINWVLSELISTSLETLLYLIAFIVLFAATATYYSNTHAANVAAAVFGIFNTVAYGASSFLLFKEHRNSVASVPAA